MRTSPLVHNAAQLILTSRLDVMENDTRGSESPSLLVTLQRHYKDRWAVLLDSIFSNQPAERVSLQNSFIHVKGSQVDFQVQSSISDDLGKAQSAYAQRFHPSALTGCCIGAGLIVVQISKSRSL